MLNSNACYLFLSIIYLPIITVNFIKNRKIERSNRIYKTLRLLSLLFASSLLINIIFFPLPIQKEYIKAKFLHSMPNYILPFERIIKEVGHIQFNNNKEIMRYFLGNIFLYIRNLLTFALISLLLCFGLFKKKHVTYFIGLSILIEILKFLANLVVGLNYKSLNSEDVIISFIGFYIGFTLFKKLYLTTKKLKNESNILIQLDKFLIINNIML